MQPTREVVVSKTGTGAGGRCIPRSDVGGGLNRKDLSYAGWRLLLEEGDLRVCRVEKEMGTL